MIVETGHLPEHKKPLKLQFRGTGEQESASRKTDMNS